VLATPARLATLLGLFLSLLTSAFTPVVLGLVLSNFRHLRFSPESKSDIAHRLSGWRRNQLFPHPSMKSVPSDSDSLCHFRRGIGFCSDIRMPHTICQQKSEPGLARCADPGYQKNIASLPQGSE
jgi:hypothetical protein